jgi:hypothetical protein
VASSSAICCATIVSFSGPTICVWLAMCCSRSCSRNASRSRCSLERRRRHGGALHRGAPLGGRRRHRLLEALQLALLGVAARLHVGERQRRRVGLVDGGGARRAVLRALRLVRSRCPSNSACNSDSCSSRLARSSSSSAARCAFSARSRSRVVLHLHRLEAQHNHLVARRLHLVGGALERRRLAQRRLADHRLGGGARLVQQRQRLVVRRLELGVLVLADLALLLDKLGQLLLLGAQLRQRRLRVAQPLRHAASRSCASISSCAIDSRSASSAWLAAATCARAAARLASSDATTLVCDACSARSCSHSRCIAAVRSSHSRARASARAACCCQRSSARAIAS